MKSHIRSISIGLNAFIGGLLISLGGTHHIWQFIVAGIVLLCCAFGIILSERRM